MHSLAHLADGREKLEPVVRIRELFDLVFWYTDGLHDLELVLKTGGFCGDLALLSLVCGFAGAPDVLSGTSSSALGSKRSKFSPKSSSSRTILSAAAYMSQKSIMK